MQETTPAASPPSSGDRLSWAAFLVIAFAIVGLVGALATFAAQIPLERAVARDQAIARAVSANGAPDEAARLRDLGEMLGGSASHLAPQGAPAGEVAARAAAERSRMLAAFGEDGRDTGFRLRIVIAAFTAAAALFGVAILSIVGRARR